MLNNKLVIGVIGVGGIGVAHIKAAYECPNVAGVIACDIDEAVMEKNTADIEVTMHDFFDDYFEVEEDEDKSAGSIDDVAWMFIQEPFMGGPIYAMARFKFQSKEELFKTLADRMSCFSNPEFIKALTLDH